MVDLMIHHCKVWDAGAEATPLSSRGPSVQMPKGALCAAVALRYPAKAGRFSRGEIEHELIREGRGDLYRRVTH